MYYWHLVNLDKSELISKIYHAQKFKLEKNDWLCQVKEDMKLLKLNLNEQDISCTTKEKFRKIINSKIEEATIGHYEKIKRKHTKTINFGKFSPTIQPYLKSRILTVQEMKIMFKLQCRMVNVYGNFKHTNSNPWCRLCLLFTENQQHLLVCSVIKERLRNIINFD